MDTFMYKEGVVNVINKLSRANIYGDIPVLVNHLRNTRKEVTDTWLNWWENYLLDAGLADEQAVRYSEEIAMYAAEQCGITLYHIDNAAQKEVTDVYTWQAELFRSQEFEQAARAMAILYNYCESHGFIDSEAVDKDNTAYKSVALELRQIRYTDASQKTSVEVILNDEANGTRVESVRL